MVNPSAKIVDTSEATESVGPLEVCVLSLQKKSKIDYRIVEFATCSDRYSKQSKTPPKDK